MSIKKLLSGIKYKLERTDRKLVNSSLCGFNLKVTPGTIRNKVDQDDTWFFLLAKHNNIIFDIGCNVGYTALLALIQNPKRSYLLVDPNPTALNEAHFNLISNNLGFSALYHSAFVSNENDKEIKFYTIGSGAAGSMYGSHAKSAFATNTFTKVNTVTLDYLYEFYNIKPDLIKIDVEGAETLAMEGAKNVAAQTKCKFFIEMHNVEGLGMEKAGQMMIDWCKELNYRPWYLKTGELLRDTDTIKNRGKCHLLLMHQEEVYPSYLKGVEQNAPLPNSI